MSKLEVFCFLGSLSTMPKTLNIYNSTFISIFGYKTWMTFATLYPCSMGLGPLHPRLKVVL